MTNPESGMPRPELWHEGPNQTADPIVLTEDGEILLVLRKNGRWALPGGFVDQDEDAEHAARREAFEETGAVLTEPASLIYEGRVEDSRNSEDRWIETSAYLIKTQQACELDPDLSEVQAARWFPLHDIPPDLHGSHSLLIARALSSLREE